jgi:hypothetical protein
MRLKRLAALALGVMLLLCAPAGFAGAEEETVTYRGITVSRDTEEVDLGKLGIQDWGPFYEFLGKLPNLKKVSMYNTVLNQKVYQKLNQLFPNVEFGCQFRFGKRRVRTDDTAFSTLWSEGDRKFKYDELSMLSWCTNLYALDIGHNPLKKLDFLYDLPELRVLIVAICDVTDITPIASLKHLEYLEIFHNRITDISCLTGLEYLMDLNLVKNKVKDLTPLTKMKSLKRLWIHLADVDDPGIPDEATLRALQEALPDCHIDAESTSTAGGWRGDNPHYQAIKRMFGRKVYEPFEDSDPENMPEPWRSEHLNRGGQEGDR